MIDSLLQRLDRVKKTGSDKWQACCPAHDSKSHASLAIRLLDDGRIVLHDFGGCSTGEVLQSIGMDFADLFPKTSDFHLPKVKRPFIASDVLRCLAVDSLVILQCSNAMRRDEKLSDADHASLRAAVIHFQSAERVCNA
jgi:hypothetical protein